MEAVFFVCRPDEALAVSCADDVPVDPACEGVAIEGPGPLAAPAAALAGSSAGLEPLRDATCRSFPVWSLPARVAARLAGARGGDLDRLAVRWREAAGQDAIDADLHELTTRLGELRAALTGCGPDERLFVLLEEKAW